MHTASDLETRWARFVDRLGIAEDVGHLVWREIRDAYASPPRAYHNLTHVACCLRDLDEAAPTGSIPVETAIWFHDAIYEPLHTDNEARSAELMQSLLEPVGVEPKLLVQARRLIMVTAGHAGANEADEFLIADVDLAILGSDPAAYDHYADAIREEYRAVPDNEYVPGRARFLAGMLERPVIYRTAWAQAKGLEARARANMRRELER